MSNRKRVLANAPGGALGDVLEELKAEGHLSERQHLAGCLLLRHLQAWHGSSAGIVGQLFDKVDSSTRCPLWPPGGGGSEALELIEKLLKGMRRHEREFLKFLVVHRELPRGTLSDWGRAHSAYKTNKTTRAVTVGRVGPFLDSVAELCLPATEV